MLAASMNTLRFSIVTPSGIPPAQERMTLAPTKAYGQRGRVGRDRGAALA